MTRRSWLQWMVGGVHALIAALVGAPAVAFVLSPILRRQGPSAASSDAATGFLRVASFSVLKGDRPVRVPVVAARIDAFTTHPPQPVGGVWLLREHPDQSDSPIRCLQVTCPHLGCAVDFATDRGSFACPCHASDFDRLGRRVAGPSPRDMDALQCRVTDPDANGRRWVEVQFERYQAGIAEKRVVS